MVAVATGMVVVATGMAVAAGMVAVAGVDCSSSQTHTWLAAHDSPAALAC